MLLLTFRVPDPFSYPMHVALGWLQVTVVIVAVYVCHLGRSNAHLWLLLPILVPALRSLVDPNYRAAVKTWLWNHVHSLHSYPHQTKSIRWRSLFVIVVFPVAWLYLSNNRSGGPGDTWPVVYTASSIVRQGNAELSEYLSVAPSSYRMPTPDDLPYCTVRTSQASIPAIPPVCSVCPAVCIGFAWLSSRRFESALGDRLDKWVATWIAAIGVGLFFLVARHLADPTTSWIATIMVAFGSTMWTTVGQSLWQHGGIVFWSLLFLLIEFHSARRRSSPSAFGHGFCWAMMLSCRLSAAIMIVPLAIWILLRDPKRTIVIATWAILAYLPWVWAYGSIYGNPFGPSVHQLHGTNWRAGADGFWGF